MGLRDTMLKQPLGVRVAFVGVGMFALLAVPLLLAGTRLLVAAGAGIFAGLLGAGLAWLENH